MNVVEILCNVIFKNLYLKVWIFNGYYDLVIFYFVIEYVVNYMFLKGDLKKNIIMIYYEVGYMVYIYEFVLV